MITGWKGKISALQDTAMRGGKKRKCFFFFICHFFRLLTLREIHRHGIMYPDISPQTDHNKNTRQHKIRIDFGHIPEYTVCVDDTTRTRLFCTIEYYYHYYYY